MVWIAAALLSLLPIDDLRPRHDQYFKITVVDDQTGHGVPLVELRTTNDIRYYTDSNGIVAFHEPGLMDQRVLFHVSSHGYELPKDGFGFRGKTLAVKEGGSARLAIRRINIAERLYRVTGGGIYADSMRVGQPVSLRHPVLNGQVFGSDSVLNAVYRGKIHWFWGDTNRPSYPLGNFHTTGATSELPAKCGLRPEVGIELTYLVGEDGFARPMAPMPGEGPTWLGGLVVLKEGKRDRLFAGYAKVRGQFEVYERGLVEFDDDKQQFRKVVAFEADTPLYPWGHPFHHTDDGVAYIYFANPYPLVRVRADPESLAKPSCYESFTCLKEGSRPAQLQLDRDAEGRLRYAWKKNTPPLGPAEQAKLLKEGTLKPEEVLLPLQDIETGKPVLAHSGSVYWNEYRHRWVMIAVQSFGTSFLGEVWCAEADTPLGPWIYARKIVTHDRYSFYNPKQHPMFDDDKGRVIFFEGTYTRSFSGNDNPTPRYEYNQILYRLDLSDPRLTLPVAIYQSSEGSPNRFSDDRRVDKGGAVKTIAFFALKRPGKGTIAVYEDDVGLQTRGPNGWPAFYVLPADAKDPPPTTTPLYEFTSKNGKWAYSTDAGWSAPGYKRAEKPLCRVWRNPMTVALPEK